MSDKSETILLSAAIGAATAVMVVIIGAAALVVHTLLTGSVGMLVAMVPVL